MGKDADTLKSEILSSLEYAIDNDIDDSDELAALIAYQLIRRGWRYDPPKPPEPTMLKMHLQPDGSYISESAPHAGVFIGVIKDGDNVLAVLTPHRNMTGGDKLVSGSITLSNV